MSRFLIPVLIVGLLTLAGRSYGWPGVAAVGGGRLVAWSQERPGAAGGDASPDSATAHTGTAP